VDAGELPVEHAAGAEAVGWWCFYGRMEIAVPQGLWRAGSEDFCFDLGGCGDFFLLLGAGLDELRGDGEFAGAVVGGMDLDGPAEVARSRWGLCCDVQCRRLRSCFDVHTGESYPFAVVMKELQLVSEPFAFHAGCFTSGDGDQFR